MRQILGMWGLCLCSALSGFAQVDTSFIYNTGMPYGTLDLRLAKSPTRYYYLQEGITFSYRESAPGVKTNTYLSMTTWNTSAYGEGNLREVNGSNDNFVMNYRLLKPVNYRADFAGGYPMVVMLHGGGEAANCWIDARCHWATASYHPVINNPPAPTNPDHKLLNNDRNLLHGGAQHLTAVNLAGSKLPDDPSLPERAFPGFVLFPQSLNGWGPHSMVEDAIRIVRLLVKKYNIDENRIYIHGLSNGGAGVYQALKRAPWLFAAALPMSAVNDGGIINQGLVGEVAKLPLWVFQGGLDENPTPQRTYNYIRNFRSAGAHVRYYLYPNLGHGTWNTAYREPDFFSWMLEKRKNNPHVFFDNPFICNTTQTGVRLGFSKGFFAYQWQRDGQMIAGATEAEITADIPGTYRGRFSRVPNPGPGDWEPWSDPVVVSELDPDKPVVDALGTTHLRGPGLPSNEANNTVYLRSRDSAELYVWFKDGSAVNFSGTDIDDTLRTAPFSHWQAAGNGAYTLVTYAHNCPTPPSDPVNLYFGDSSPQNLSLSAGAFDLKGTVTHSSVFLSWKDVSGAEAGYEIWRRKEGAPYFQFVVKTSENAVSYHDSGLDPGTTYEYKLRAVNNSGRSNYVPSDDLSDNYRFTTGEDFHSPSAPQNLRVLTNTLNTITLGWDAAQDDGGIREYRIYYGNDSLNTGSNATSYTLTGLPPNRVYPVWVTAVDHGNHWSQPSNQITATTYLSGLVYKHSTGAWESLDDESLIATWETPEFTGTVSNFTLQPRTQDDYFNFQFLGYLNIENEGTYYFNLTSSDGSRLFLDGNMIVDNDGIHGNKTATSEAIYLTAGPHAIEVQYFDDTGGHTLNVRYKGPGIIDGDTFVPIPDSALRSGTYIPPPPPQPPANVVAHGVGMRRIDIRWEFDDDAQTDYEVYRATHPDGPFEIVVRAPGMSAVDTIGLMPGTLYYYQVKTVKGNVTSAFSEPASATTAGDAIPPTAPANLVELSNTLTGVALSWSPSTDNVAVLHYEIFQSGELIGTSEIHAFTAEQLEPGTEYVFTVKAVDASDNRSASSPELVVVTGTSAMFYSLASGNLNELATWRSNVDGTGDQPQDFSDNGQLFVVSNRTATTAGGPWHVGGTLSRIIIPDGVTLTADQPLTGNVELQGSATLILDHATAPLVVKASPSSTVEFRSASVIPAATYGHVVLSGSVAKTFGEGAVRILGNLVVGEGLPVKGAAHNASMVELAGTMTLQGTRPSTAADNAIDLLMNGPESQTITAEGDIHLYRIALTGGKRVNLVSTSEEAGTLYLGSLQGGGLVLPADAILDVDRYHLFLRGNATINPENQTGVLAVNGGNLQLASAGAENANLYFAEDRNTIDRLSLDLQGSGQAIVRSPLQVAGGIHVINGTLAAGGNVTLLADEHRTAVLYEIGDGGRITGDVTVLQYVPASGDVFRYLSTPVKGVAVADWQESFPVTGSFAGSSSSGDPPSLYRYRQTDGGWLAYPPAGGSANAAIEQGVGYAAGIAGTPLTILVRGNPYQGPTELGVRPGMAGGNAGWSLVGNPYAAPVRWSLADGAWALSGVSQVMAIRKDTVVNGQRRSWFQYHDIRMGDGVIPAGAAFWVKTFTSSPSLVIDEQAKAVNPPEQPASDLPYFVVTLKQGAFGDPAYVAFSADGTDGLDPALDAFKLRNNGLFNLSTLVEDTVSVAVNHLSQEFCSKTVDLSVEDVSPGSYALAFDNLEPLTGMAGITLTDHFAGTTTTITGADYSFTVTDDPASYGRSRFTLTFSKQQPDVITPSVSVRDACAPGPGYIIVSDAQEGALYEVIDAQGQPVSEAVTGTGQTIEIPVPGAALSVGINRFRLTTGFTGCDRRTFPGEYELDNVTELAVTTAGDVSVCEGENVTLSASGAPSGGYYKWYDHNGTLIEGETASTLVVGEVLLESVFYVSTALDGECESERAEIHIYPDTLDMPVILVLGDTLYTDVVGFYQWTKEGEDIPGATLNYYIPVEDGLYAVVASNGGCVKESDPYQIGDPVTGVDPPDHDFVLNVYPMPSDGQSINVIFRSARNGPVLVEIVDALGRLHYHHVIDADALAQGTLLVPKSRLYNGVYFLRVTQAERKARKKIIVADR